MPSRFPEQTGHGESGVANDDIADESPFNGFDERSDIGGVVDVAVEVRDESENDNDDGGPRIASVFNWEEACSGNGGGTDSDIEETRDNSEAEAREGREWFLRSVVTMGERLGDALVDPRCIVTSDAMEESTCGAC